MTTAPGVPAQPPRPSDLPAFLQGGGDMARRIAALDWAHTPLGPLASWPAALRTTTAMLLRSPIPIVLLWGEAGTMIYNDPYSRFAGQRHPRLLGQAVREGWPEVADFNDNVMRVGLAGGTLVYRDQQLSLDRHGQPAPAWMDLYYSPVPGDDGLPEGVIATVIETTERVLTEQQRRASEARLSALVNATADVVYRMAPDWSTMIHLDGKGFISDNLAPSHDWLGTYVHAEDRALVNQAVARAIAERSLFELRHRVFRVDGSVGWTLSRAVPLFDEQGQISEWFGTASDITEHEQAQLALRENEARLRFLDELGKQTTRSQDADVVLEVTTHLLGLHLGVSVCAYADMDADQDGFTIRGNWHAPGAKGILGHYRLADFGRLAVHNLRAGLPLVLEDNAAQLPPHEARTFLDLGLAATVCMPLVKEGRLTALMAVHDRLPRRWSDAERALLAEVVERSWAHIERVRSQVEVREGEQRFVQELERQVAERTAALEQSEANIRRTEQALQQAQKMEALGNLTGGIAHDFNNLLMAVLGNLELMQRRVGDDPALLRLLGNAQAGAQRGAALIERMLAFARRQELRPLRLDATALVQGMADLLRRSLGPTVQVELDFAAGLPWVETDPNQLESALLNLAVNARDAMGGQGRLRLTGHAQGGRVCLAVADNGQGMSAATLARATEPFFTTKGVGKGTGLGLSMVLGLAEQSGGSLVLLSEPGQGTTAQIWLPAHAPGSPPGSTPLPPPGNTPAARWRVLAVDDDELVLGSTLCLLKALGHDVVAANSAAQALRLLAGQPFDALVSDHAMPEMTGTQLAEQVRALHPQLAIVLVSGYSDVPLPAALNVVRLAKPFSQNQLAQALHSAVAP
ncbi:ATP-binding protein [Pseudomonas sp. NPDC007930]|uniref:ATP-binding protein n=1 Tax=Pseudomonas sp. NPDC007930 TaxID=3364417 RepID=UPI0036E4136D